MSGLFIAGFGLFGLVLPELCASIGGNRTTVPGDQNLICAIALMLISQYFAL